MVDRSLPGSEAPRPVAEGRGEVGELGQRPEVAHRHHRLHAGAPFGVLCGVVTAIVPGPDGDLYVVSLDSGTVYRISAK